MKFLFPFLFILTNCGSSSSNNPEDFNLQAFNKSCAEQKLSGEYLVEFSDKSRKLFFASTKTDLFEKINSSSNFSHKRVLNIDYNFRVQTQETFQNTSSKDINSGPLFINAQSLWEKGFYGQGVRIALIDSGYDINHPFLLNSVLKNKEELGNDEDHNGFIGDAFGWDFINKMPLTGDLGSHGTLVGGVIAAQHTLEKKFSIAPESKIIPIAALQPQSNTDTSGDSNSILDALDYAVLRKAHIINASWAGANCSKFIQEKIKTITNNGIAFITSSGNEGQDLDDLPIFPSSFPFSLVLSVGSSALDLTPLNSSNYGNDVDFFTLGSNVYTTYINNGFRKASGTSVAAPFISGAFALLKSAFPQASHLNLSSVLKKSRSKNKIPDLEQAHLQLLKLYPK